MTRRWLWQSATMLALVLQVRGAGADDVPTNGWVVWESNRADGRREIYFMKADGTGVTRLTHNGARVPRWSPDGRWVVYEDIVDTSAHVMRWDGTEEKRLFEGKPYFWMHDNSGVVCKLNEEFWLVDPDTGDKKLLFRHSDFTQMGGKMLEPGGITADGRWMIAGSERYRDGYAGNNGSFKAGFAAVLLDLKAKDKVYFVGSGCGPTTAPTGSMVYHVCGDTNFCSNPPDLYKMDVADLMTRSSYLPEMNHPNEDWGHEYFPKISNDNQWLIYAASTGCHDQEYCDYEIFVHRLGAGYDSRARLTYNDKNDQYPELFVGDLWQPQSQPKLALSPDRLTFNLLPSEKPTAQTITIKNLGGGTLDTIASNITYADGSDWLTVTASGSGNQQSLSVSLDETRLAVGQHRATLTISAGSAQSSPTNCEITVNIANPPQSPDGGTSTNPTTPTNSSGCSMAAMPVAPLAGVLLWAMLVIGLLARRRR